MRGVIKVVIAVESGLQNISEELRKKGYTIVAYPEYKGIVDAFIYKEDMINSIRQYQNSVMNDTMENDYSNTLKGVLVINANNKNINQIEAILKNRVYSPLF